MGKPKTRKRSSFEIARELRAGPWPNARVAVNVSPQQFLAGRFVESVERALRNARMTADCLEIELTESALQTGRRATESLLELRRLGIAVALDDFGTGYSSLAYLCKFPFSKLKIDRSFAAALDHSASAKNVLRAIVKLGHGLGMSVTAEGIETVELATTLATLGCASGQGYYFAKPLEPVAALEFWKLRNF